jgi:Reverse transcriptase (RNA-dependent DNA polymerase)
MFLCELNGLELHSTDIGNAYLESETNEKVAIIAGPKFGEREGHVLLIRKALYGLRSSGKRWHEKFVDCMRYLGFSSSKAGPDVWMRRNGDIHEYVAVYVDDLADGVKDPGAFFKALQSLG